MMDKKHGATTLTQLFVASILAQSKKDGAKSIVNKLINFIKEREAYRPSHLKTEAANEIYDLETQVMKSAAEMIPVLETEQWRQREAIKLFLHGQIDRNELRRISETWNGQGA